MYLDDDKLSEFFTTPNQSNSTIDTYRAALDKLIQSALSKDKQSTASNSHEESDILFEIITIDDETTDTRKNKEKL